MIDQNTPSHEEIDWSTAEHGTVVEPMQNARHEDGALYP